MQVERIFLLPNGLPARNSTKHALFASPSFSSNQQRSMTFPGIHHIKQQLDDLKKEETDLIKKQNMERELNEELRRHLIEIVVAIHKATIHLQEFHTF